MLNQKIVSEDLGKIYYEAFEKRQEGDYQVLKYFSFDEVNEDLRK